MLGMVDGNGHPYSWSAILNGRFDAELMRDCGFPVIPQYLGTQPPGALGIDGAKVTHVWCEDAARAKHIAAACFINNVLATPQAAIGQVDAVIIPTDIGEEHLERARPFIEAGLPVFIDKPMTTDAEHLKQFVEWKRAGKRILSTSAMRYAQEFLALKTRLSEIGEVRLITATTPKSWERYGIHAIEMIYGLLEPGGWLWAANAGDDKSSFVHLRHASGADAVIAAIDDLYGCFGHVNVYGTKGALPAKFSDTFSAFNAQLVAFVDFVRTGQDPFDFAQTVEQMKMIIAGTRSRHEGGRRVPLSEV
jgi:predicted dehydrogenase